MTLKVGSSSAEHVTVVELFHLEVDENPCVECLRKGRAVAAPDLAGADARWPHFVTRAQVAGFRSVYAMPSRFRYQMIGGGRSPARPSTRGVGHDLHPAGLAERRGLGMPEAFAALRGHVGRTNRRLNDLARDVVNRTVGIERCASAGGNRRFPTTKSCGSQVGPLTRHAAIEVAAAR